MFQVVRLQVFPQTNLQFLEKIDIFTAQDLEKIGYKKEIHHSKAMFSPDPKLAVLESKLSIYEDLSREMLAKLESAVDKISESNSRIATILAKHDERIEQSIKNDDLLIKMIDEMKENNDKEHQEIEKKFEKIEMKLEDLSKFKWQIGGVLAVAVVLIGVFNSFIPNFLTSQPRQSIIERTK